MDVRKLRTRHDKDIVNSMAKKLIKDGLVRIKNQRQDSSIAREDLFRPITKSQEAIKKTFGEKQDEIMAALANMTTIPQDGIIALQQELERAMDGLAEEVQQKQDLEDKLREAQRLGEQQVRAASNAMEDVLRNKERELDDMRESAGEDRRRIEELVAFRQYNTGRLREIEALIQEAREKLKRKDRKGKEEIAKLTGELEELQERLDFVEEEGRVNAEDYTTRMAEKEGENQSMSKHIQFLRNQLREKDKKNQEMEDLFLYEVLRERGASVPPAPASFDATAGLRQLTDAIVNMRLRQMEREPATEKSGDLHRQLLEYVDRRNKR